MVYLVWLLCWYFSEASQMPWPGRDSRQRLALTAAVNTHCPPYTVLTCTVLTACCLHYAVYTRPHACCLSADTRHSPVIVLIYCWTDVADGAPTLN